MNEPPESLNQPIGVVTSLTGRAFAVSVGGVERALVVGDQVYPNEMLRTAGASTLVVDFGDGRRIDLGRTSEALLDEEVYGRDVDALREQAVAESAAIQAAIAAGGDPVDIAEPPAAGNEASDSIQEAVRVDRTGRVGVVEAGYETGGFGADFRDDFAEPGGRLIEGLPVNPVPSGPSLAISTDDAALAADETALLTFQFSEAVTGFTFEDVAVTDGTLSEFTQLDADTWTARLTPPADFNGDLTVAVADASYTDLEGNVGSGDSLDLTVDTLGPTLEISTDDANLSAGETAAITFQFSEAVAGFDASDIAVAGGTLAALTQLDADTWRAVFTPEENFAGRATIEVADATYSDLAGNQGAGDALPLTVDTVVGDGSPTLTITADDAALAADETALLTFQFSEAVTGFTFEDVAVTDGTLSEFTQLDADTWTARLTPPADFNGDLTVAVADASYTDLEGNVGSGDSLDLTVDTLGPTLEISTDDANLSAGETAAITFQFSEAVAGFDASDIGISSGDLIGFSQVDADTWTATYVPDDTFEGDVAVSVADASYTDLAGNDGSGASLPLTVSATAQIDAQPDAGEAVLGEYIYVNDGVNRLAKVHVQTGATEDVVTTAQTFLDIASDGSSAVYGVTQDGDLYTIDPTTGDAAQIGPLRVDFVSTLAMGDDGMLYAVAFGDNQWGAYTVDAATGAAALIKPLDYGSFGDIVVAEDTLYFTSVTSDGDALIAVDLRDAADGGTVIGPTVADAFGLALGPDQGLYATALSVLYQVDTTSGAFTFVADMALGPALGAAPDGTAPVTGNVLTNDTDPEGDPLVVSAIATADGSATAAVTETVATTLPGSFGVLTIDAAGDYTYVVDMANPVVLALNPDEFLREEFAYSVTDGDTTANAALSIDINGGPTPERQVGTAEADLLGFDDLPAVSEVAQPVAALFIAADGAAGALARSASEPLSLADVLAPDADANVLFVEDGPAATSDLAAAALAMAGFSGTPGQAAGLNARVTLDSAYAPIEASTIDDSVI